jgi:DNA-binding response OmpR family regulator
MGARTVKALIVGDDPAVVASLVGALVMEGHSADVCPDAATVLRAARSSAFDLLVVARTAEALDALALVRRVRAFGRAEPVVMVAGNGDDDGARLEALDAGVDEVVTSPFDPRGVVARGAALLARAAGVVRLRSGALDMDRVSREAWLEGRALSLTSREYEILAFLLEHVGRVVSAAELLARVWRSEDAPSSNLVQVHVSRLREKLGAYATHLETVRGAGYRLRG